ncbi:MAG: MFS transporter [Proteobacteria bacterium]|nr:YbfB/YjiJ family MFS transporter [Desulfobacula sp.]MBU3951905.1 MFS transporter [Pseudomonadota bacterium]MBU4132568.1 MFS transporter [Pseudomonadota bacterium]
MKESDISKAEKPFHYGWIIVFTGVAILFACLGLGRFAIGMLLPSMGLSLDLNYSQMGFIGTGNFVGYMVSVLFSGMVANRLGARNTIFIGLLLVGFTLTLISQATAFFQVLALYTVTGIGTGLANVPLMGLISHWFLKSIRGRAAGTMLSGNGLAIVFAGVFVPWINGAAGAGGWRIAWISMGAICLVIAVAALVLLRNDPAQKGLAPLGENTGGQGGAGGALRQHSEKTAKGTMVYLGCIYLFFGATYSVYVTFIVTALVKDHGLGEGAAGFFWAVVGGLSIFSGPLFGGLSDRIGRRKGLMMVYGLFTIAYTLAAAPLPDLFLYASIVIFGLIVWSIPTIMSAAVGDYMGPARAVRALGFITLFFGAGQIAGPAMAGFLADVTGSFSAGFWLCAVLTALAAAVSFFLKPPPAAH